MRLDQRLKANHVVQLVGLMERLFVSICLRLLYFMFRLSGLTYQLNLPFCRQEEGVYARERLQTLTALIVHTDATQRRSEYFLGSTVRWPLFSSFLRTRVISVAHWGLHDLVLPSRLAINTGFQMHLCRLG